MVSVDFSSIGEEKSNEWKKDDNVDDFVVKNHLEITVGRVATDKEFYIFNLLM
ncbi:TPA: hypothetical protein ACK0CD_002004 [Staphylococcus aureus]